MNTTKDIQFIDNKAAQTKPDYYMEITVDLARVLKSWKNSLYSFEWLNSDGKIKPLCDLSPPEQAKRQEVEDALKTARPLERPVLGIGLQDNVEIGSGRAIVLTLAANGWTHIPVHIPKSCESDFKPFHA
ncbi:MAG: hypothetical protein H6861_08850 [Rhodospirillales bacterium]|nr:hypothetical protein [Rhodospirillales bacterium]